ncbi:hypothetical protein EUGRSUZ_A00551 [Eucalyptus grandis]|uniref:Uncharacterized protein n=2 Tax=Eucalyptus grandis TaxID=71139 RepID=A0ACC3M1D8_EUCGR|nr:hypothetical protein EUGRSUZ_A00551 [Eucalyptus grandis]
MSPSTEAARESSMRPRKVLRTAIGGVRRRRKDDEKVREALRKLLRLSTLPRLCSSDGRRPEVWTMVDGDRS